jgi:hypothetical protein
VIRDERNTLQMSRCKLGKSGVVELVRDDAEEEEDVEDAIDGGRVNRPA